MKHLKSLMLVVFVLMATARARADISTTPVTASTDAAKNLYAYFLDQYFQRYGKCQLEQHLCRECL